jgi:hypothetical protein
MPVFTSTNSGGKLDLKLPDPRDVRLTDIAVHLSKLCRYNGATSGFWSVAQHSLLCEALLPDDTSHDTRLAVLLHDAHEAYTGDITTPVALALGWSAKQSIDQLKGRIQAAIEYAFGAPPLDDWQLATIRLVDILALSTEKTRLTLANAEAWAGAELPAPDMGIDLGQFLHSDTNLVAVQFLARVRSIAKFAKVSPFRSLGL